MIFFILLRFYSVLIFLRAKARRVGVQGKGFQLPLGMIFFIFEPLDAFLDYFLFFKILFRFYSVFFP